MKKITKILALLLTLTIAVGMFTACGDNAVNDGKVTLKVGDCPSKGEAVARVQAKIERFEKDNPDVKIEPDTWTFDLSTFYPKAEAGMLPDVFISYFTKHHMDERLQIRTCFHTHQPQKSCQRIGKIRYH